MRRRVYLTVAALLVGVGPWLLGQDRKAEIQKSLSSQFTLTQTTADKSDIATAGAVLVLHKNGLVMYSTANPMPPQSIYKKGKIARNVNFWRDVGNAMATQAEASDDIVQRNFVAGEKSVDKSEGASLVGTMNISPSGRGVSLPFTRM